ncbi:MULTISPECIES: hypothetical protein [unclassified Clostridioides]|uniref:hypothetical protein n=1 Tax=unclassified Clostridioides TaxID=2635829 RepID=UPI001D119887
MFPPLKQEFEKRCFLISDDNRKEIEAELCGKIIDTPGHTSDSISLLLDIDRNPDKILNQFIR